MKLLIDIPEYLYERIKEFYDAIPNGYPVDAKTVYIAEGIPLPKGHGRIIDESKINKCYMPVNYLDVRGIRTDAPTIIEPYKERSDE